MMYRAFSFVAIRLLRNTPYSRSYSVATARTPRRLAIGSMMQVIHAPKSEIDRTVRVIDRAVKIIDIHCAVHSRSCWFIQLNYNKNCHIYQ